MACFGIRIAEKLYDYVGGEADLKERVDSGDRRSI